MKFEVDRLELKKWMDIIGKVFVFTGQFHEMFQCVRFEFLSGQLQLETFDNISCLKVTCIEYHSDQDIVGSFLFPVLNLSKIINASSRKSLSFEVDESHIIVKAESCYKFPRLDESSYPNLDKYLKLDHLPELQPVEDTEFVDTMDKMLPFVTGEMIRPELSGIAVSQSSYVSIFESIYGVIHQRCENILGRIMLYPFFVKMIKNVDPKELKIGYTDTDVFLHGQNFFYTCRLPGAVFPYDSLVGIIKGFSDCDIKVKVDSKIFFEALRRVVLFRGDIEDQLKVIFKEDGIDLVCLAKKHSSRATESISVIESNIVNPLTLLFKAEVFEACRNLFSEEGTLYFSANSDGLKAIFVREGSSEFMFFAMPMREIPV